MSKPENARTDEYKCPECGRSLLVIFENITGEVCWLTCPNMNCYFGESIEDWNKRKEQRTK